MESPVSASASTCCRLKANVRTDWLEGVLLMASYIIIAVAAWFYPEIVEGQC